MKLTLRPLLLVGMLNAFSALAQGRPLQASVLDRQPNAGDAPPAYQQDMQWLDPTGHSWVLRDLAPDQKSPDRVGQARAVWLSEEPVAPVLDAIGGVRPVAAYGTLRLTSDYSGAAIAVTNASSKTTLDIAFLPDGTLDERRLASFCALGECRVSKWYDQTGHGNDAVAPNTQSQPSIRLGHRTGQAPSVIWDFEATSGGQTRVLKLPAGLTIDSGNMAVLWTGRFHNASIISPLVELGTDKDAFNFGYWDAHGDFYIGTQSHLSELQGHAAQTAAIGVISSSPGDGLVTNYRNQLTTLGKLPSEIHRGGLIGQTVVYAQSGMMELSSLILYDRGLTSLERLTAQQALGESFTIAQQQQDVYVADGDSLTQGIASPYLQAYPWHMEQRLPRGVVVYNAGWAAKTLAGPAGLVARYGGFTAKLFNPHARQNVISVFAGTNDIQEGRDDSEVFGLLKQYATLARKTGFKVVLTTIIPRASFTPKMEGIRTALNAMIRKNWKNIADGLVDLAANPAFSDPGSTANTNLYAEDGIHLTDFGYQIVAANMSAQVCSLLE